MEFKKQNFGRLLIASKIYNKKFKVNKELYSNTKLA